MNRWAMGRWTAGHLSRLYLHLRNSFTLLVCPWVQLLVPWLLFEPCLCLFLPPQNLSASAQQFCPCQMGSAPFQSHTTYACYQPCLVYISPSKSSVKNWASVSQFIWGSRTLQYDIGCISSGGWKSFSLGKSVWDTHDLVQMLPLSHELLCKWAEWMRK